MWLGNRLAIVVFVVSKAYYMAPQLVMMWERIRWDDTKYPRIAVFHLMKYYTNNMIYCNLGFKCDLDLLHSLLWKYFSLKSSLLSFICNKYYNPVSLLWGALDILLTSQWVTIMDTLHTLNHIIGERDANHWIPQCRGAASEIKHTRMYSWAFIANCGPIE